MKKFEYFIGQYGTGYSCQGRTLCDVEEYMNEKGREGWKLISHQVRYKPEQDHREAIHYMTFIREKRNK